ncbi:MAG: type VI secretion system baseplate subunit TssE [Saprospiraceae bacterium]|nr:type VI secretion system baseplate subunit TssE [Pyrinomonadaceae bacterium]
MARIDQELRITPSVLDRLLDYSPKETQEAVKSRSASLRDLRNSVRRDLEWLLNTRCHTEDIDNNLLEARKSVAFYGLPDFTGLSAKNSNEQKRLTKALENSLQIFEPRFRELRIRMEPMDHVDRQLKFRIEARLHVESASEPIAFDTVLEVGNGGFAVNEK